MSGGREGRRAAGPRWPSPPRLPLPCCLETEAFPSEAEGNGVERDCFMETTVATGWKAGTRPGSGPSPGCVPGVHLRETLGPAAHSLFTQGFPRWTRRGNSFVRNGKTYGLGEVLGGPNGAQLPTDRHLRQSQGEHGAQRGACRGARRQLRDPGPSEGPAFWERPVPFREGRGFFQVISEKKKCICDTATCLFTHSTPPHLILEEKGFVF